MKNAQQLLDKVRKIDPAYGHWIAVYVNMSHLRVHNQGRDQIMAASSAFTKIFDSYNASEYRLSNGDFIVLCDETPLDYIQGAIEKVKGLFSEDPFAVNEGGDFCILYDLRRQYPEFLTVVAGAVSEENLERPTYSYNRRGQSEELAAQEPLTLDKLQKIEDMLKTADISNLIKHQAIFELNDQGAFVQKFQEVYVSIRELQTVVAPQTDFFSCPWLFFHLTRTLDRRMLSLLRHFNNAAIIKSYSINLNISTILSPLFQRFHESFRSQNNLNVVIEIQKMDAFADIGAFTFACDYLKNHGYKVALDAVTHLMLPYLRMEHLPLDFVKLQWSSDLNGVPDHPVFDLFNQWAHRENGPTLIMTRCDTEDAVAAGKQAGIGYFQGYYIDKLIAEKTRAAKVVNLKKRKI